jgi:hypothetical protein
MVYRQAITEMEGKAQVLKEASELEALIPKETLKVMTNRVKECWDRYTRIMESDEALDFETGDKATEAVKNCLCRELNRIRDLNLQLPDGQLKKWWEAYCDKKK